MSWCLGHSKGILLVLVSLEVEGSAAQVGSEKTLVVPDVDAFPGHIACSSASRSEIVVPLRDTTGEIVGVLDIDSDQLSDFSEEVDRPALERIALLLAPLFSKVKQ